MASNDNCKAKMEACSWEVDLLSSKTFPPKCDVCVTSTNLPSSNASGSGAVEAAVTFDGSELAPPKVWAYVRPVGVNTAAFSLDTPQTELSGDGGEMRVRASLARWFDAATDAGGDDYFQLRLVVCFTSTTTTAIPRKYTFAAYSPPFRLDRSAIVIVRDSQAEEDRSVQQQQQQLQRENARLRAALEAERREATKLRKAIGAVAHHLSSTRHLPPIRLTRSPFAILGIELNAHFITSTDTKQMIVAAQGMVNDPAAAAEASRRWLALYVAPYLERVRARLQRVEEPNLRRALIAEAMREIEQSVVVISRYF